MPTRWMGISDASLLLRAHLLGSCAVNRSGCRFRVTYHPGRHLLAAVHCVGEAPHLGSGRECPQCVPVAADSRCVSRPVRPGNQSQAWAGSKSRHLQSCFATVAQDRACRDCGGIGTVKERSSGSAAGRIRLERKVHIVFLPVNTKRILMCCKSKAIDSEGASEGGWTRRLAG